MDYGMFNGNDYLTLLNFLYKYDDKLTSNHMTQSELLIIKSKLYKLMPVVSSMSPEDFCNSKFESLSDTYWDGGSNNYNTHFEIDDDVDGPEDVFIDEIASLLGCFPSNHYQNFYYMFDSGNTKYYSVNKNEYNLTQIDLLNVIHHLIATYDFFKPFGCSLSYFDNSKESQNIKLINDVTLQTIDSINKHVNNNLDDFNEYDSSINSINDLFAFVSNFNKRCLKSYKFLNE